MKPTILAAILIALSLVFSGCIIGADDPMTSDDDDLDTGQGAGGDEDPDDNTTTQEGLHAAITASNVTGTVPFTVTFNLSSESEDPQWLDWSFDADGNGTLVKTGYGLPAEVEFEFTEPGDHTARLTVTDMEGFEGVATLVIKAETPPPVDIPEPIVFEGTITGIWTDGVLPMDDEHLFNVTSTVSKITLTFEVGPTAVDLDFTVYAPDDSVAGSVADENDPTGTEGEPADSPIVIDDPETLAKLGEWKVAVHPFLAIEGDYTITITFE